jgi:secreted trypsin-like serine protease
VAALSPNQPKRFDIIVRALLALAVLAAALTGAGAGRAIIGAGPDSGAHPAVGLLVIPGAGGLVPECSGVLVAPRVFVTAGHCSEAALAAGGAYVVFGDQLSSETWTPLHGTATTDPGYGHSSSDPHDLGVVVLDADAPVQPASLPRAGAADGLAKAGSALVSVGYGYSQSVKKTTYLYDGLRHAAEIPVVSQTSTLLRLGGSTTTQLCFGDSGGPQVVAGTSTVVSLTSAGSPACEGTASATRLDTPSARAFLGSYVSLPS